MKTRFNLEKLKRLLLLLLIVAPYAAAGNLYRANQKLELEKETLITYAALVEAEARMQTERLLFVTGIVEAMSKNAYICEGDQL